ncbi:hypothetical protein XAC3810_240152 [Xanthomonas citri pv. citri]|uniref:Uncharacterized protein n=1 Tax=Xanthomonas citri pv. citri TaxID=611301 RepID=A0A0U5BQU0_XANCI|nr:hypothetical protein XAC9322_220150 [Xanthomonas citri pv. citri]CEE20343.1 hypothetical protein XAC3824_230032 [Xanthomonas citri pv. citri]CEE21544.1 hypothetical protein XAC1083_220152 [Xanthomonas citri pv. citri]CEE29976.1 hypothetical protein XAC3810_240152 [Xanthomonas citri pv. citri]CEE32256.1 hypothetical protein XAC902_270151 [Xanthomonas citri pv. citri]
MHLALAWCLRGRPHQSGRPLRQVSSSGGATYGLSRISPPVCVAPADVRTSLFTAEDAGDASGAAQAIARLAQLDAAAPSSVAIARSMRRSHARRGTSAQAVPWAGAGPCVGERNAG